MKDRKVVVIIGYETPSGERVYFNHNPVMMKLSKK